MSALPLDLSKERQSHSPRQVLRCGRAVEFTVCGSREKMVNAAFMKKYIHVAKIIKPMLTQESAAYIAEEYSRLRSQDSMSSDTARVRVPQGKGGLRVP